MLYPLSPDLQERGSRHCAPLFIIGQHVGMAPTAADVNATITFIRFDGRTFGITCEHVVSILRKKIAETGNEHSHTFFIALLRQQAMQDRFRIPSADWTAPAPDIAIREIHPELPAFFGKESLDIEAHPVPPLSEVAFGVAMGFPNNLTTQKPSAQGYQLAMPCVEVVAQNHSTQGHSFTLFSELSSVPMTSDLSGLSGGPIYWSNETDYGLLGITYEAPSMQSSLGGEASIHIKGHLADRSTLTRWVSALPRLY